ANRSRQPRDAALCSRTFLVSTSVWCGGAWRRSGDIVQTGAAGLGKGAQPRHRLSSLWRRSPAGGMACDGKPHVRLGPTQDMKANPQVSVVMGSAILELGEYQTKPSNIDVAGVREQLEPKSSNRVGQQLSEMF